MKCGAEILISAFSGRPARLALATLAIAALAGCGAQPAAPKAAAKSTVAAKGELTKIYKLALESSNTWYWSDRTEVEFRGKLDGFYTRIKVEKDMKTGKVSHDVSGSFMSAWQLERALEDATVGPGVWQGDVRRAIDMLRWGRGEQTGADPVKPSADLDRPLPTK